MAKFIILLLVTIIYLIESHGTSLTANDLRVYEGYKSVYYDPATKLTLKTEIENSARLPNTRIGFRSLPCACQDLSCGCCAGINLTRIQFDQKACTNFTYDPYEFSIKMELAMNDKMIYNNEISAKNPPPMCIQPFSTPLLELCIKFFNVFMPARNIHVCIDFETRLIQSPVFVLHFDCVRIGADGIVWLKPEDDGGLDIPGVGDGPPQIAEPEVYDEVNFEPSGQEAQEDPSGNSTVVVGLADEDQIGQLKL